MPPAAGRTGFNRRAVTLLLPAALNLGIANILAPVLNALLARTVDPAAAIGGYAVAFSVIGLVALPQLRIQQLTLVFLEDRASLGRLRRFVGAFALLVAVVAVLVALTPLADVLLDRAFTATGALREQARAALIALVPFPALAVVRTHLHGAALRIRRAGLVWAGTVVGAAAVVAIGVLLLLTGAADGSLLAAIAVSSAAALEVVFLLVATARPLRLELPGRAGLAESPSYAAMLRFFAPLLFAAFLPSVTPFVINAVVARAPEPEVSIAAVSVAVSVFHFRILAIWGVQPMALALLGRGDDPRQIARFANAVGGLVLVVTLVVAFVPALSDAVLHGPMGASGRLQELAALGLCILAPLPLILVQEQLYASALMRVKRTRPILYVNLWRLASLLLFVVIALNLTDLPGAVIGVGATALTLAVEAVASYLYGRGAYRSLVAAWEPARA